MKTMENKLKCFCRNLCSSNVERRMGEKGVQQEPAQGTSGFIRVYHADAWWRDVI